MEVKKCHKCGRSLPIDEFRILKSSKDGHNCYCNDCARFIQVWSNMKQRCYNPKCCIYKHYGARGITVCEEWRNSRKVFEKWAFNNGYEKTLTLDRIDNNGNYEPTNCRWTTMHTQAMNKRMQSNNTSGYIGISNYSNRWYGNVSVYGKRICTGSGFDIKEVIKMRNDYIIKYNLENKLNVYGTL